MFGLFSHKKTPPKKPQIFRAFAAAEVSRILNPWKWDGGFSNSEVATSLVSIRSRSRDMQKNSEHYCRWLGMFVANVVGPEGFTLIPKPCAGEDPNAVDDKAAKFLKYHFWKWATTARFVDVTGRKTFAAMCRLVAENWARDGEGIVLIDRHAQNPYGLALRVIRPDALDEGANGITEAKGNVIRNGVEVNVETLRPAAYLFRAEAEDTTAAIVAGRLVQRIDAAEILHVFTQHDECQTRGIPLGHAALKKLKMIDEYNIAELVAARDESNTTGVFTAPAGSGGEIFEYDDAQSAALTMESEPGTKLKLEPGWDYKTVTPTHPNRELTNFKNSMLRDVATGLGVEYANFSNDWAGVSYSSVRVGTLAERDNWKTLQSQMIEQFVTPVYLAWLESFLKLAASGSYSSADFTRLADHEFRGRRWEWVDPMKDVNAAVIAVAHNWKTNEQIAADYGADLDDNIEANAKAKEKATAKGVAPPKAPTSVQGDEGKENDGDK